MEALIGKDVVFEILSPNTGDYLPYICAEECEINFDSTLLSTKTRTDGPWESFIMDTKSFTVSLSGLIPYTDESLTGVTAWDLYAYYDNMTEAPFRMIFRDPQSNLIKAILGNVLVNNLRITANATDFAGSSKTLRGTGQVSVQDNLLACQAVIGNVVLSLQSELIVRFAYSGLSGAVRIEFTIDGGARRVFFPSASELESGTIGPFLNPVQTPELFVNGEHTVEFFPVCESGEDGESFILTFTKT